MAKGDKADKTGQQQQTSSQTAATPAPNVAAGNVPATNGVEEIDFSSPAMLGSVNPTADGDSIEFEPAPLASGEFVWRHRSTSEQLPDGGKIVYLGGDLDKIAARDDWGRVIDEEDMPIEIAAQLSYYKFSAEEARTYWRADPDDFYAMFDDMENQAVFPEDFPRAAQMLSNALENGETIGIHYDYDTDGICSGIVLEEHLRSIWPLPDTAIEEKLAFSYADAQRGFGFFESDVDNLVEQGATLAFVLDSGPPGPGVAAYAQEKGLKLIYVDHHELGDENISLRDSIPILKLKDDNAATAGTAAAFSVYHKKHPLGLGGDITSSAEDDFTVRCAARQFLQDQMNEHYEFYRLATGPNTGSLVALPKDDSMEGYYLTMENEAVTMPASMAASFLQTQQDGLYEPCPVNRVSDELLMELGVYSPIRSDFYKEPLEMQDAAIRQSLRLTPTQAQAAIVGNLGDAGSMMSLHNRLLYAEARTSMLKPEEEQTPFMHAIKEVTNTRNNGKGFSGEEGLPSPADVIYWLSPSMSVAKRTPDASAGEIKAALHNWTPNTNVDRFVDTYMDLKNTADAHVAQFTDATIPNKKLPEDPLGLVFVPGISEKRYMGMGGRLAAQLTRHTPNPVGVYIEDKDTGNVRVNFRSGGTKLNIAELIDYCKAELPDIPITGGGHAAAGGLLVPKQHWKQVYPVLQAGTAAQANTNPYFYPAGASAPVEEKPIYVTCPSSLSRINSEQMHSAIKRLQPFDGGGGKGNREPIYLVDAGEMTIIGKAGRSHRGKAIKDGVEMIFLTTESPESFPHQGRAVFAWDNKYDIFRTRRLFA